MTIGMINWGMIIHVPLCEWKPSILFISLYFVVIEITLIYSFK